MTSTLSILFCLEMRITCYEDDNLQLFNIKQKASYLFKIEGLHSSFIILLLSWLSFLPHSLLQTQDHGAFCDHLILPALQSLSNRQRK